MEPLYCIVLSVVYMAILVEGNNQDKAKKWRWNLRYSPLMKAHLMAMMT